MDILQKIGLSEHESKVYTSLLSSGQSTISDISKKTGIHRPIIYKILPGLHEKGLITSHLKGKRTIYTAEPPEKLEKIFDELTKTFMATIPELAMTYKLQSQKPLIRFFDGKKGITSVFEDVVTTLNKGDVYYRYSSRKSFSKNYLSDRYRRLRDQKKIDHFIITSEVMAKEHTPLLEREMKFVPKEFDLFDQNITQIIYDNKVAFIDYNSETAAIIENSKIADFQKKIFKLLYSKL